MTGLSEKVGSLEPPTSLKEAVRELKHVEQIGTPLPIWTKLHRCEAGRNQALKLMPKEPISILFLLIRSQTLLSSSRRLSTLGGVASILIVAVPLWPRTRTLPLPKCALKTLLSMRLRCAAIAISPNVCTTFILSRPARIQRLLSAKPATRGWSGQEVSAPPKSKLQAEVPQGVPEADEYKTGLLSCSRLVRGGCRPLAQNRGAQTASFADAAKFGEVVTLVVKGTDRRGQSRGRGRFFGRPFIDATNIDEPESLRPRDRYGDRRAFLFTVE